SSGDLFGYDKNKAFDYQSFHEYLNILLTQRYVSPKKKHVLHPLMRKRMERIFGEKKFKLDTRYLGRDGNLCKYTLRLIGLGVMDVARLFLDELHRCTKLSYYGGSGHHPGKKFKDTVQCLDCLWQAKIRQNGGDMNG